jgi:hypothetical protein
MASKIKQDRVAPAAAKRIQQPLVITRGETIERVIFRGSRKALSRRDLHVTLEPIFRRWIHAACSWEGMVLGDYRFVIFSMKVAPETQVYVQFWSEPMEPTVWEVSSGKWNPPADEWLAGGRARRIEGLGFAIGGNAENYHRTVRVQSAAEISAVAKTVVDIFYTGFDYRGTRPIVAEMAHQGRSQTKATYDWFTPQDVAKVFAGLGFRVEESVQGDDDKAAPALRCRRRAILTQVDFDERVNEDNLYRRVADRSTDSMRRHEHPFRACDVRPTQISELQDERVHAGALELLGATGGMRSAGNAGPGKCR